MEMVDDIVKEFLVESYENLDQLDRDLMALEDAPDDRNRLSSVFRTIHTIKGTSGFLAYPILEHVAHVGENLLVKLRDGVLQLNADITSGLLEMVDAVRSILGRIDATGTEGDDHYEGLVARLELLKNGEAPATPLKTAASSPPAASLPSASLPSASLPSASLPSASLPAVSPPAVSPTVQAEIEVEQVVRELTGDKTLASAIPPKKRKRHRSRTESQSAPAAPVLGATTSSPVREAAPAAANDSEAMAAADGQVTDGSDGVPHDGAAAASASVVMKRVSPESAPQASENCDRNGSAADSTVRIDVNVLDRLMNLVGELVLARNQIMQFSQAAEDAALVAASQRLNLITTELQEGVMKTRMQPIRNAWNKLPRVVRDLSISCGKLVQVEMEGAETELDKTILEAIRDPLTHIVRNSVDHGIESSEVRKQAGKPEQGTLRLRAYHEGGQVNIEIADDGAGISVDRVRQKAVEKGMVTAEQASGMSDREAIQLILLPGFSTAAKVTNVSGRGVGMDVVKTNVEKIGGTLEIHSIVGQGTTLRIKIPLTLAIIPALIVTTSGDRYAIPQVSLLELVRLEGEQVARNIEYVHGAPVYRLRGKLLPLVCLNNALGMHSGLSDSAEDRPGGETRDGAINIVVLRANDRQYGLVVDKVNDSAEIVVKPLSRQLKGLTAYAGTTIMGDGTVALILDVMGLAIAAGLTAEIREQQHTVSRDSTHTSEATQTLLVVDLGDTRRFALPTSMVARLEKVAGSAVESADGHEVIQYRGKILPIVRLASIFGAAFDAVSQTDELQIIVYEEEDYSCGFAVSRIVDIVETELRMTRKHGEHDNLLGTTVIQDRVTDVLNLRSLARH